MPRKSDSRKSLTPTWFRCDVCEVHITSKERETHDKNCPITNDSNSEYIQGEEIHTSSVEKLPFMIEEISELSPKYRKTLIFVSEGAMRLANLHIGEEVIIKSTDDEVTPIIRKVWPIAEKFLTTILVSEEDFNLNWTPFLSNRLTITKLLNGYPHLASSVQLKILKEPDDDNTVLTDVTDKHIESLTGFLLQQMKQLIYISGNIIQIDFFNKSLKFVICDWSEDVPDNNSTEESIELALKALNLNCSKGQMKYFKVGNLTKLNIEGINSKNNQIIIQNKIKKTDVGGMDKEMEIIEHYLNFALGFQKLKNVASEDVKLVRCVLLHGPSGCGKSMICQAMCSLAFEKALQYHLTLNVIKLNSCELFSKILGETERNLEALFEKAYSNYPQPTLMILEDIHNLSSSENKNDLAVRVNASFGNMLDTLNYKAEAKRVFVIATTSKPDTLSPSIRRSGRLDFELEIGAPTPKGRIQILNCLLRKVCHNLNEEFIEEIGQNTHGYIGADLAHLVTTAILRSIKTEAQIVEAEDISASLVDVKPSAMREVQIECPNVSWSDIGGQSELKLKLMQSIEWPLRYPEKFKLLGIKPPRGLLMFGPPGCSKTMVAKALATESGLNFLSIKGPELFSMWVGESERAVRDVFRKARQVAPSILFFDEIDAISGERSDGGSDSGSTVKERVLTQLLTEMDGVEALENVTIVAATNRPDMIDKALLRPGRIDRIIYVGLPDADARREIFQIKLKSMPITDDVNLEKLVQSTEGYSGAEIQAICNEAALKTLEGSLDADHATWKEFEYALTVVKPRTSSKLLRLYEEYLQKP